MENHRVRLSVVVERATFYNRGGKIYITAKTTAPVIENNKISLNENRRCIVHYKFEKLGQALEIFGRQNCRLTFLTDSPLAVETCTDNDGNVLKKFLTDSLCVE